MGNARNAGNAILAIPPLKPGIRQVRVEGTTVATIHRRAESVVTRSKEVAAHLRERSPAAAAVADSVAAAAEWSISASGAVVGFDPVSAADALMMASSSLNQASGICDFAVSASRCAASACCFAVMALRDRRVLGEAESQIEQAEAFATRADRANVGATAVAV